MVDAKAVKTPLDPSVVLLANDGYSETTDRGLYQQLVGSLLYAAICTRPDIAHAVAMCCRFTANPNVAHLTAAKRILRYLWGTSNYGLLYQRHEHEKLIGYSDADWAGDHDTRRSTTGHVLKLTGAAITWLSQRQPVMALSSTEAEYIALSSAAQQAVWLRRLYEELGLDAKAPNEVCEDNQGAICLASNPVAHKRTKHIDIRHHYICECVTAGLIKLVYVPTQEMTADLFTKSLPTTAFQRLRACLGIVPGR